MLGELDAKADKPACNAGSRKHFAHFVDMSSASPYCFYTEWRLTVSEVDFLFDLEDH